MESKEMRDDTERRTALLRELQSSTQMAWMACSQAATILEETEDKLNVLDLVQELESLEEIATALESTHQTFLALKEAIAPQEQ